MPLVDVRDVEVIETISALAGDPGLVGDRPCPFCGDHRKLVDAHPVRVRNRTGGSFERWVLMCSDCLTNAR